MKKKVITCITTLGMTEAIRVQLALQEFIRASATTQPLDVTKAQDLKDALQAAGAQLHDTSIVDAGRSSRATRE